MMTFAGEYAILMNSFVIPCGASSVAVPGYLAGHVPKDVNGQPVSFPFITFEMREGDAFTTGTMTFFFWVKKANGIDANALRDGFKELMKTEFPYAGRLMHFTGGCAALYRDKRNFLEDRDDKRDPDVCGVKVNLDAHFYE